MPGSNPIGPAITDSAPIVPLSRVKLLADSESPESSGSGVGAAEVDTQGPVPGDGLVGTHGVLLGAVVVGVSDKGQDVVDLFKLELFVRQGLKAVSA